MKYAYVDNKRAEAAKGLMGLCPICQQPVIPKCGNFKIHHWAHKNCTHCDKWWENETEWHRKWKNLFPEEWQEVVAFDNESGEKHIADIKTDAGMVVEFQHSYLKEEERISREKFYKDMIWVVDGTRRKRDYIKFIKAFEYGDLFHEKDEILWVMYHGSEYLPKEWLNCCFPVIFDFKGIISNSIIVKKNKENLWCLLPIKGKDINVLLEMPRDYLVDCIQKGGVDFKYEEIARRVNQIIQNIYYRRRFGI